MNWLCGLESRRRRVHHLGMMGLLLAPVHILLLLIGIPLFLLPILIAGYRGMEHFWWLTLANIVTGGTGVGWLICLIWSLNGRRKGYPSYV